MSRPFQSQWAQLLGWDLEIYCLGGRHNILDESGGVLQSKWARERLSLGFPPSWDAALNDPGCHIASKTGNVDGNELAGVDGTLFVTGRSRLDGRPLNSRQLCGIMFFLFQHTDVSMEEIRRGRDEYFERSWKPDKLMLVADGVDVYSQDVRAAPNVVDHT